MIERHALLLLTTVIAGMCQHAGHDMAQPPPPTTAQHAGHQGAQPTAQHGEHGEHRALPPARPSAAPQARPAPGVGGDAPPDPHAGHAQTPGQMPAGYAMFDADLARLSALGLETTKVEEQTLARTIRTVGVVTLDETRTAHVHTKVRGFVEGIHADFVGKPVKRGEALASIFSQDVVAAQLEYLALAKAQRAAGDVIPQGALDAAKRRLWLWDVPPQLFDHADQKGQPIRMFTIVAPRAGTIVSKRALLGTYVEPGAELFTISDLSRLWVQIDLYAADVTKVKLDQEVELRIEGVDEPIRAAVTFLAPTIDEATRTLRARIEVRNDAGLIRPGAFVGAELEVPIARGLVVPESAVVRTGLRDLAFVLSGAMIEPRQVKLGPLVSGRYRVDSGLTSGEEVVTGAQFLIDAESRLRASSSPGGAHAGH